MIIIVVWIFEIDWIIYLRELFVVFLKKIKKLYSYFYFY